MNVLDVDCGFTSAEGGMDVRVGDGSLGSTEGEISLSWGWWL